MNSKVIVGIVVAVLVVTGGFFVLTQHLGGPAKATPSPTPAASQSAAAESEATITYSASGFSPATTTVMAGKTVMFTNSSSQKVQIDSDPHPVHTDDPDLNVGVVEPGQSRIIVVKKTGTFGIHNHLNPSETAKITIQ